MFEQPLNTKLALSKGIELFYEYLLYIFLISLAIFELKRGQKTQPKINIEEIEKLSNKLNNIDKKLERFIKQQEQQEKVFQQLNSKLVQIESEQKTVSKYPYCKIMNKYFDDYIQQQHKSNNQLFKQKFNQMRRTNQIQININLSNQADQFPSIIIQSLLIKSSTILSQFSSTTLLISSSSYLADSYFYNQSTTRSSELYSFLHLCPLELTQPIVYILNSNQNKTEQKMKKNENMKSLVKYAKPTILTGYNIRSQTNNIIDMLEEKNDKLNNNTEDILNSILPPREYTIDKKQIYIENVLSTPATIQDVKFLHFELNNRLNKQEARQNGICPIREDLFSQCFDELIRQITISCSH